MGTLIEGSGMGGRGFQDVGDLLQGSGAVSPTIWVRNMGDIPKHCEDAGRIQPPGDTPNDGAAAKM